MLNGFLFSLNLKVLYITTHSKGPHTRGLPECGTSEFHMNPSNQILSKKEKYRQHKSLRYCRRSRDPTAHALPEVQIPASQVNTAEAEHN